MQKKLSIAFLWHMHQPVYQETPQGVFLMPWVRLHAIKDYLDMLLTMNEFKGLKLNFNLVPILLSALQKYSNNEAHDIHSKITVTPIEELSDEDKLFILNNFFDANFANMILHHKYYADLYQKRYSSDDININSFSEQEYSDILAWFNLAWFDPCWKNEYPELNEFAQKNSGFTLEDRKKIIEIQREIIKRVIPTYKKYQDEGKIEILTSPYYHPIIPLLLDKKFLKCSKKIDMKEDAKAQLQIGIDKYEEVFECKPRGIWPPEHCVSTDSLKLFAEMGFKWTISDEGILAETLKKEFIRDYKGYLEEPYDLSNTYKFKDEENEIAIIFRDSVLPNLINFEYSHHDSIAAANDLYERIKITQNKLKQSPSENNLLTIALDGENCWESYANDGETFLKTLYELIEKDKSLETVLISEYIEKTKFKQKITSIHPGSWINRNFKLWVNEPTKDLAWNYLIQTRNNLKEFEKETDDQALKEAAWRELYVAQGSDWFWWLGEPNDSGQDEVFDYLFRRHLSNIYQLFEKPIPDYLRVPLIAYIGKPARYPKNEITPIINGVTADKDNWANAGCIDIPDGPVHQSNKLFDKVCFGYNQENLYLRFDINQDCLKSQHNKDFEFNETHTIYIYLKNEKEANSIGANIRTINQIDNIYPILAEKYTHEIKLQFYKGELLPISFAKATPEGIWVSQYSHHIKIAYKNILEIAVPFKFLELEKNDKLGFFIINGTRGITNDFYPKDMLLPTIRP